MKNLLIVLSLLMYPLCLNAQDIPVLMVPDENSQPDLFSEDIEIEEHETDAFGEPIEIKPQIITSNKHNPNHSYEQEITLDTKKSLTDNFKSNAEEDSEQNKPTTWLESGTQMLKNLKLNKDVDNSSLSEALEQSKGKKEKSNAAIFNISGVMLRMDYNQAEKALTQKGYKKISQKMEIPNFIKWRNEETCRNNGIVGYERLNSCVIQLSRKDNHEFVSQVEFNKFDTKETIEIYLTSNFTGNKIYKITYLTQAAAITGNSHKAQYLRKIKVYDFWKKINQKYGAPDNKQDATWGLGGTKPYMKAKTGFLLLEDPMLKELDYTRMSREDNRFLNTDIYSF